MIALPAVTLEMPRITCCPSSVSDSGTKWEGCSALRCSTRRNHSGRSAASIEASSCSSTSLRFPITGASTCTVLLISTGSISMCIFFAPVAKRLASPTMRSSNRLPAAIIKSAPSRVKLAYASPCIPGNPTCNRWSSEMPEIPSNVVTTGMSALSASRSNSSNAREIITPCPASITGRSDSRINFAAALISESTARPGIS